MSLLFTACGSYIDDGGTCPPYQEHRVASGEFTLINQRSSDFPVDGASELRVDVDRDASRVIVTYDLNGEAVVETYRITGSKMGY